MPNPTAAASFRPIWHWEGCRHFFPAHCGRRALSAATVVLMAFTATAASLPPNLARSAKATATSEFSGQYLAQFAVDGKIPEAGSQDDLSQAWCVRGDTHRHGAELSLEWTNPVTIAEVVYYGRTAWFAEECWCFTIVPAPTLES